MRIRTQNILLMFSNYYQKSQINSIIYNDFRFPFCEVWKKINFFSPKINIVIVNAFRFPAFLIDNYQQLMQINKPLTPKEKKIQKRERAKLRRKNQSLQNFSFQNELIDLVSEKSEKINDEIEQNVVEKSQAKPEAIIEEKRDEKDSRNIRINDEEYYLIVEIGKFYRTRKENERNHCEISVVNNNDCFIINGSEHTLFQSANSFIFQINRKSDQPVKFDHYFGKLSAEGQQKITKSMLNLKRQTLIRSSSKIQVEETTEPWANLPKCIQENDSLMIVGVKNTGKSTLAQYLLQSQGSDCVLLDCDIGRNSCLQGCVSLSSSCFESKKIWIGQLTPLNNLQTYLRAIRYLFDYYNEKWFTKKLIVNTMGYLTGLGQFLLYQIYQIVKPKSILALQANSGERYQLSNVLHNFKSGNYVNRLYISNGAERNQSPSSTAIYYYENLHSLNKKSLARFQKMFQESNSQVRNIVDLIHVIKQSSRLFNPNPQLISKERIGIDIYEQSRHGKEEMQGQQVVSYRKLDAQESVDMRLVILGKMIDQNQIKLVNSATYESSSNLFEVSGLGFGFQGKIYYKKNSEGTIGIVNEGMDFEKGFYHLNEKQLLDLELRYGRLNFIMVTAKGLGSKGVRNNPSKVS